MVHFPISVIVRRHWFILWQSSPFFSCDSAVKGSPDEPNAVAVDSDVTQAVAVKVDEGCRPGATAPNSTAPMSHRAVPSLLPSTWRAKPRWSVLSSALNCRRIPFIAVNYTIPPAQRRIFPAAARVARIDGWAAGD